MKYVFRISSVSEWESYFQHKTGFPKTVRLVPWPIESPDLWRLDQEVTGEEGGGGGCGGGVGGSGGRA